jgi:hypothetical protein
MLAYLRDANTSKSVTDIFQNEYQVASKAKKWYSMSILISKEGLAYATGIVEHP